MEENEYKNNEKVLYKTRGKLILPGKEPEEVDCFVTESYVIIDVEGAIKIPLSCIQDCDLSYDLSGGYKSGTAKLTFADGLNEKHELSLKIAAVGDFKHKLLKYVQYSLDEYTEYTELSPKGISLRMRFPRESICADLLKLGIDAKMTMHGRAEEYIWESKSKTGVELGSYGLILIPDGPIRWVNIIGPITGDYYTDFGVPDTRLETKSPNVQIKSDYKKTRPLLGIVVDLEWKGNDSGLGIISRLNTDILLKQPIIKGRNLKILPFRLSKQTCLDVKIGAFGESKCWIISTKWNGPLLPLDKELWDCYQRIANHLLANWKST